MRDSSRQCMVVVLGAAAANTIWLASVKPDAWFVVVAVNISVGAIATAGYAAIATFARRSPEAVVFLVLVAVDIATLAIGMQVHELGLVAAGYLLMLPTIVALVIPWDTRIHVTWLALHAAAVIAYTFYAHGSALLGERTELIGLLAVAAAVSQFGHMAGLRARTASFEQLERIRRLNRQAARDHARLDRVNLILELASQSDELTGLKNRLGMKADLRIVRSRMDRHDEQYALMMLDLDHFKAVNDERGHGVGDDVLRTSADAIVNALRPGDGVYRRGGEEFVVVLRIGAASEALVAAERIRQSIFDLGITNAGNQPHGRLTISIGVTAVDRRDLDADDEMWLGRADAALYRAKALGRNRCEADASVLTEALVPA